MEVYKLTREDYELINKLIKITHTIDEHYNKLSNLEIDGKQNSDEFNKVLEALNKAIELENSIYQQANLNFKRSIAIGNYICYFKLPMNFANNSESIARMDYDNHFLIRIINNLESIADNDPYTKELIKGKISEITTHLGMNFTENEISHKVNGGTKINSAIEKDIANTYLIIVDDYIKDARYQEYKDELIKSKYNSIFINKEIEADLIKHNFVLPQILYHRSKLVADFTVTDAEDLDIHKNVYGLKLAKEQIFKLAETSDVEFEFKRKAISSIIRECLLRSAFLIMNDEIIMDLNYEFHEFIEEESYIERHGSDKIGIESISKCFQRIKTDKNKLGTISLSDREM